MLIVRGGKASHSSIHSKRLASLSRHSNNLYIIRKIMRIATKNLIIILSLKISRGRQQTLHKISSKSDYNPSNKNKLSQNYPFVSSRLGEGWRVTI